MKKALLPILVLLTLLSCRPTPTPTPTPEPVDVFYMHGWRNSDWSTLKPEWKVVGDWMPFGWDALYNDPGLIDTYLSIADGYGKKTAISVMLYETLGRDATPPQVYASIGRTSGWPIYGNDASCPVFTIPAWGDQQWEDKYYAFVAELGAKYNGDPRIAGVWICTGLYGETATTAYSGSCKYDLSQHNFVRFVYRSIDAYVAAFPDTPIAILATGTVERRAISLYAAERGVAVKQNALAPDLPNHHFPNGGGLLDVVNAVSAITDIGFEHAFAANSVQTYWSMLVGLTHSMDILDLPEDRLDLMASTVLFNGQSLWDFINYHKDSRFFVARDTQYRCVPGGYECGWEGPFASGIDLVSGSLLLAWRGSDLWLTVPGNLTSFYGAYGIGLIGSDLVFDVGDARKVFAVVADSEWQLVELPVKDGKVTVSGHAYLHVLYSE